MKLISPQDEQRLDRELTAQGLCAGDFAEVDVDAPLDVVARIAEAPLPGCVRGMFFEHIARSARKLGVACEPRYVPFRNYPLRDHMQLMVDYGQARYGDVTLREALRRVGWEAFPTLMNSVAGRVIFTFAGRDVGAALRVASDAYKHSLSPGSVSSRLITSQQAVLEFRNIWNFPEAYQVGAVEGGCRAFDAHPRVRTRVHSNCDLDMLIRW